METSEPKNLVPRRKVCLIDDEADIREIYTVGLTTEGFEVLPAENGEAGLRCIREDRPDIVVLDLQMPVLDGLDVLKTLTTDKSIPKIPVIILSNTDNEETFRKAGEFNASFFFVKALSHPKKVAGAIREVLSS